MIRLTVIGGSSPFSAGLVEALLARLVDLPPMELVFHGRSDYRAQLLARYGSARLEKHGWRILAETRLEAALQGADLIINQIRFGGMALRNRGELFCEQFGVPADETLGPAALLTALSSRNAVQHLSRQIKVYCPDAWVLQLTNPLSTVTSLMALELPRVLGLCELPRYTLDEVLAVFDLVGAPDIQWAYEGFNHRGFIYDIRHGNRDLLAELPEMLGSTGTIGGIDATTIASLGAVPLKYFRLFTHGQATTPGRAAWLENLRARITSQLEMDITKTPPALSERYLEWYPRSVVPMIVALHSDEIRDEVINKANGSGLVIEACASITRHGIELSAGGIPPSPVRSWLNRFRTHETLFRQTVLTPTPLGLLKTLLADPVVPESVAQKMADELWDEVNVQSIKMR